MIQTSRKWAVVVGGLAVTIVAVGELAYYGSLFPQWITSPWKTVLFYGALASLSWLFIFLLAFPVLVLGAIGVFFWRKEPRFLEKPQEKINQQLPNQCHGGRFLKVPQRLFP